jgi:uncharacterized protein YaiL (DUF2058 family)
MGTSLQDQMLKAGLVDKKKASQARKQKQKQQRQKNLPSEAKQAKADALAAATRQAQKDRELNLQRKAEADRKALQAQIRQLVESNRIPADDGDIGYNFTHDGKVRTLLVTPVLRERLTKGQVAVVVFDDHYALVPHPVAEKIRQRDELSVITPSGDAEVVAEDDPYADYQVPDDLVW